MGKTAVSRDAAAWLAACLCAAALALGLMAVSPAVANAATRATDVTVPSAGNELVVVPGTFTYKDKAALLKQVNALRKEACDEGVPDPGNPSRKLTPADYRAIKWSAGLEEVAQTRAAEASVLQDHQRPNGGDCFDIAYATQSWAEVLAWNGEADISGGIDQWYEEKADWVKQNHNAVTGHYESLINPSNTHIGLGGFLPSKSSSSWGAVAGEFDSDPGADEPQQGVRGSYDQVMEVPSSSASYKFAAAKVAVGGTAPLEVTGTVSMPGIWGGTVKTGIRPQGGISWSSSDPAVATVSEAGALAGAAPGATTVTASFGAHRVSAQAQVVDPRTVTTVTVNASRINASTVRKALDEACADSRYVTQVVLGAKTRTVASGALAACPKAKTVRVQTKKLTRAGVKGSLKGTAVKTVRVSLGSAKANRSYVKKYRPFFAKKNSGKSVALKAS